MEIETNGYYVLNTNGVQQIPVNVNIGETGKIQSVKNVDITSNGKTNVLPDEGYNGIANVVVNTNVETDVKVQDSKEVTITSNGSTAVVPDTGFAAIKSVFVNTQVPEPESEASKSIDVVENGSYTVTPTSPYNAMKSVTCNVNVPLKNVQPTKTVSITNNGNVSITPDVGYDGIGVVNADVNVHNVGFFDIAKMAEYLYLGHEEIYSIINIIPKINTSEDFIVDGSAAVLYNLKSDHNRVFFDYMSGVVTKDVYKYCLLDFIQGGYIALCDADGNILIRYDCERGQVLNEFVYANKGLIRCTAFADN